MDVDFAKEICRDRRTGSQDMGSVKPKQRMFLWIEEV
jgi:hypothetical protein